MNDPLPDLIKDAAKLLRGSRRISWYRGERVPKHYFGYIVYVVLGHTQSLIVSYVQRWGTIK